MLTEIFCIVDDFCKEFEKEISKKTISKQGRAIKARPCGLSRSEIVTILIFFHHSKYRTFKDYYENLIRGWYKKAFRGLVSYNRFVRLAHREVLILFIFATSLCPKNSTGIHYIDSMTLVVFHNKRIYGHKTFKGFARRGKSYVGWFFGFKLHFVINAHGEIVSFAVTPGNVSDKNSKVMNTLTQNISGKLFGDKGYISSKLFKKLFDKGVQIITKIKRNMKNCFMNFIDKILFIKKRCH